MQRAATRPGWLRWSVTSEHPEAPRVGERPRLLLEYPDDSAPAAAARGLAYAGFEVTVCNGPVGCPGCALADIGSCGLVEDADIVVALAEGADRDTSCQLVRSTYPDLLVVGGAPGWSLVQNALDAAPNGNRSRSCRRRLGT